MFKNKRLKKLLYHTIPTALKERDLTQEETFELFGKNIKIVPKLYIDGSVLNYIIISFDNFTPNATNPEFRDNVISFDCVFAQTKEFYQHRRDAFLFEGEKNKLLYDMEIEPIYLLGDFSVKCDGAWENLNDDAVRFKGNFKLDLPQEEVYIKNLEQQGFPFFCGRMSLEGDIDIRGENPVLKLDIKGVNVVIVEINGRKKVLISDDELSLKEFGIYGKTKIKLILINNLRNVLGPHHMSCGESYFVEPSNFYKEKCVWNLNSENEWDDDYCFVKTGL